LAAADLRRADDVYADARETPALRGPYKTQDVAQRIKRLIRTPSLGLVLLLAACAGPPVETAEQAIALGSAACAREWEKDLGIDLRAVKWQAQFYNGDRWRVWAEGRKGRLEIIIPKSEAPSKCAMYDQFVR